jgi:hypothetical protein
MPNSNHSPGHRGAVRDPANDRRLKNNRGNPDIKGASSRSDVRQGGQGRVKNPGTDRRLKHNR